MGNETLMAFVGVICTALSSVITFFLTKRKYNTEVDSQQIENMSKSFDTYKKMMEETLDSQKKMMEAKINTQNNTIDSQNKKIDELQKENENLRRQVSELQLQFIKLFGNNFDVKLPNQ